MLSKLWTKVFLHNFASKCIFLYWGEYLKLFLKRYIFLFYFCEILLGASSAGIAHFKFNSYVSHDEKHSSTALSINACPDTSAFIHVTVCFQGWATLLHFCEVTESALSVDD